MPSENVIYESVNRHYGIRLLVSVAFLFYLSVSLSAADELQCSTSGKLCTKLEYAGEDNKLWIFYQANPENRRLLMKINRYAEVIFSPDEKWLLVNDYFGSNVSEVLLFQHRTELEFVHLDQTDITGMSWDLFQSKYSSAKESNEFINQYITAVEWAADSSAFLLKLAGTTETNFKMMKWFLVFDMRTRKPTSNLQLINGVSRIR